MAGARQASRNTVDFGGEGRQFMTLAELMRFRRLAWPALLGLALAACSPNLTQSPADQTTADTATSDTKQPDAAASSDTAQGETLAPTPLGQFNPALLEFGPVDFGKCAVKTVALSNWGTAPLTVQGLDLTGLDGQFAVEWLSPASLAGQGKLGGEPWLLAAPLVLQVYQSAGFGVQFCPSKAGPVAAKVPLLSDGGPLALEVKATGVKANVPCYSFGSLSQLEFGDVAVGKTGQASVNLWNCGSMDLVVTKLQLVKAGADATAEFAVSWGSALDSGIVGPGPTSEANPLTVGVGTSTEFEVAYNPADITPEGQADTAKLTFGFSHGAQVVTTLTGRGIDPKQTCPIAVVKVFEGNQVVPQTNLHIKGTGSYSPSGAAITKYKWSVKQPLGSNQPLIPSATFPSPTLTANVAGEYEVCLDVWDEFDQPSCKPSCVTVQVLPYDNAIHIELLWDTPSDPDQTDTGPAAGADLDLHFAHPLAAGLDLDCDGVGDPWFSNPWDTFWFTPNPAWGDPTSADDPSLDLDDTSGEGPENLNADTLEGTEAEPVTYAVGVHYWNDHGYGASYAKVRIYLLGKLFAEFKQELKPADMWYVGKLHWPNALSGGSKLPFETCYQSGFSCPAGKNLMWQPKGDYCITPCYESKSFLAGIGSAAPGQCAP
jgi:hypothetical protein